MRALAFVSRNRKELSRDPLNLVFGVGFPLVLLLLMSLIQDRVPVETFRVEVFTPGMAVFSLSFVSLFGGALIAKDRSSAFLMRLFSSPLTAWDFITGYALPLLPLGIAQSAVCFVAALFLGLPFSGNVLLALAALIPSAVLFTGMGILLGTLFSDKQVGPFGSILVNVATLLGGTWFDLEMIGGTLKTIGYALPFAHAVDAARAALVGEYAAILPHLWWVLGYAAAIFALAVLVFKARMRNGEA